MSKLPVFVSHSTDHTNDADMARLRTIVAELGTDPAGFDVMWDGGEIAGADDWYARIHIMLAECRAAIMLFSERALTQSPWVLKEATILSHRVARDPAFRLLPIIMPGADESHLGKGVWDPLRITTIQYQRQNDGDVSDLVARARAGIDRSVQLRTPLDELVTAIAAQVEHVPEVGLRFACENFLLRSDWEHAGPAKLAFAVGLARRLLRARSVTEAVTVLDAAHGMSPDAAQEVYNIVSSLWVDPQAAAPLQAGVLHEATRIGVALNGRKFARFTAERYVRRAHPGSTLPTFSRVTDANAGDLVQHIAECMRAEERQRLALLSDADDDDIDAYINNPAVQRFVLVPMLPTDVELTQLRALYPQPLFIFSTGASLPTDAPPTGVRYLEPELELAHESRAFQDWMVALNNVDNRRKLRVGGG